MHVAGFLHFHVDGFRSQGRVTSLDHTGRAEEGWGGDLLSGKMSLRHPVSRTSSGTGAVNDLAAEQNAGNICL